MGSNMIFDQKFYKRYLAVQGTRVLIVHPGIIELFYHNLARLLNPDGAHTDNGDSSKKMIHCHKKISSIHSIVRKLKYIEMS